MPATRISIATFNLLNLSAVGQTTHNTSRPIDQDTFNKKVNWIVEKLHDINADVIGFQEVWSRDALVACFEKAGLRDKYQIVARDGPPGLVQVAAAVRNKYPILNDPASHWIEKFPPETKLIKRPPRPGEPLNTMKLEIDEFSRPVLNLELKAHDGVKVRFFVIHLKSKLGMDLDREEASDPAIRANSKALGEALSAIRRTAEVAALRVWLNKELRETHTPLIVVGDLNDGHLSTTAAILSAQPPIKLFEASTVGNEPTKAGDVGLYSAQMLQEYRSIRDVYYTYDHQNILESLDHIFVSEEFYQHSPNRIWTFRDLRVINDHIHARSKTEKVRSDHGIIVARFDAARSGGGTGGNGDDN
jgi:endonuclease/exonuclease/phosphatase family metal-dependent hydrolase